jgi:hypothetical protein
MTIGRIRPSLIRSTMREPDIVSPKGSRSAATAGSARFVCCERRRRGRGLADAPRRIGAIGLSAGGYGSLWHAAFDHRIAACASSCGVTHWHLYAAMRTPHDLAGFRGLISGLPLDPNKAPFPYENVIKLIAPRPLFLHCPLQDNIQAGDLNGFRPRRHISSAKV